MTNAKICTCMYNKLGIKNAGKQVKPFIARQLNFISDIVL